MLDPNNRSLLTSLLMPPLGLVFDKGIATTYSLDPLSLLGVPVHLAWMANRDDASILQDPIRLLESLQRVAKRLTVFADRGRIAVPGNGNALFSMLESTIAEVRAPGGGAFHPKLWLLRFADPSNQRPALVRLGVLSRNLTSDRCWDLSLVLEGEVLRATQPENRPLCDLLKLLPDWAVSRLKTSRRKQLTELTDDLLRTKLAPPADWQEVKFHVLGLKQTRWRPGPADEIALISPFLTDTAVAQVCGNAKQRVSLISRPDTLSALSAETRASFSACYVLDDAAETEDGEEQTSPDLVGLHAKAILLRRAWMTHLYVGSANVTNAAMVAGTNVEVLVELIGKHSKVGQVTDLLSQSGFGAVLAPFTDKDVCAAEDAEVQEIRSQLEKLRRAISDSNLKAECIQASNGLWQVRLTSPTDIEVSSAQVGAWLLSQAPETAVDAAPLMEAQALLLPPVESADVTGLVALSLSLSGQRLMFVLNLPLTAPEDREAAIMRRVIRNREGFVRYLKLLLGGFDQEFPAEPSTGHGKGIEWKKGLDDSAALLEDLVRVWSREPKRLDDVARVVEHLRGLAGDDVDIVPPAFDSVWKVFEAARAGKGR